MADEFLSDDYPETCPEGATEVTEPLHTITLDVRSGDLTCTFGPGEEASFYLPDAQNGPMIGALFMECVAHHLAGARPFITWASPAVIEATLAKTEAVRRSTGKAPF